MIRFPTLLFLIVLSFTLAFAQDPKANFKTFTDGDFTFEMPALTTFESSAKGVDRTYAYSANEIYLRVYSEVDGSRFEPAAQLFASRTAKIRLSDGVRGTFGEFDLDDGYHHYSFMAKIKDRTYIFHAIAREVSEELPRVFFNSIRFRNSPAGLDLQPKPEKSVATTSPTGKPTASQAKKAGTWSALKILSKPRPAYTPAARIFDIQGTVILTAVFQADGSVGEVTVVKDLPFGLARSAVDAAKAVRFEPARLDGVPQDLRKNIEYTFTIF